MTIWKRLSRAGSFSMYFLYSSSVVAPMQCSSPLARSGLRRLPASMLPSLLPAPTMLWISSMKRMILPLEDCTSLRTAFKRSSNSPLYFAPATRAPMSSEKTVLSFKFSGTSCSMIRLAKPSAIAVLPTPGSPIKTGLFFVLLANTWMTRLISLSRPITGSILPWRAASTRSTPYLLSTSKVASGLGLSTLWLPLILTSADISLSGLSPAARRISAHASFFISPIASRRCSTLT